MSKILVTGATGHLGRQTIEFLSKRLPKDRIVAMARDPNTLSDLSATGVDVRAGDYTDRASLTSAFAGVERVLLVSAVAFTDRLPQHLNVIEAAKSAGVRHLVYTSIQRKAEAPLVISGVTESDIATEEAMKASGLDFTILHNALYLDTLPLILGDHVLDDGVRVPGGVGKGALVLRRDLAEANAVVLTESGHANRSYILGGAESFSFADVAQALGGIAEKRVPYVDTPVEAYVESRANLGLPRPVAAFLAEWVQAVAVGEYGQVTGDLERLIGRKPLGYADFLEAAYPK
jgi:NAD(P)H dehydrogenase (quinone)